MYVPRDRDMILAMYASFVLSDVVAYSVMFYSTTTLFTGAAFCYFMVLQTTWVSERNLWEPNYGVWQKSSSCDLISLSVGHTVQCSTRTLLGGVNLVS